MSETTDIKNLLTECHTCLKQYDRKSRVPRRMPCCSETVCEPCLTSCQTNGRLICPLCQKETSEHKEVSNLPIDPLVIKLLSQNTTSPLTCTFCSFNNPAIAKCCQCSDLLCQSCLSTHSMNKLPINHDVISIDAIKQQRAIRSETLSRSLSLQSMNLLGQLKEKGEGVMARMKQLDDVLKNIGQSRKSAMGDINKCFDDLLKELQERRKFLLSQVELRADQHASTVKYAKASHHGINEKIKKLSQNISKGRKDSPAAIISLLQETAKDVDFARKGVCFVPANTQHLFSILQTAGLVRSITFTPAEKPWGVPDAVIYNAISLDPISIPQVSNGDVGFLSHSRAHSEQTCSLGDQVVVLKTASKHRTLFCPNLEWDTSTANRTVTTSGPVITNTRPEPPLFNSGCRIQADRHVMTSKPLLMRNGQQAMYQVKVKYNPKMLIQDNKMLFEVCLTDSPVDSVWSQPSGLSVNLASCSHHLQQLCLRVVYDNQLLEDTPIAQNEVGVSRYLHLAFLLNSGRNEIHVIDVEDVRVISTVTDVDFDNPLWLMMMLAWPSWANMAAALASGTRIDVSKDINKLLSSLQASNI
ncbi:uncharacterized protein LOC124121318 [Haliotis rufescens]|uniref:uncharacterized protein LOC124121318 n=1 Tax=Haliotis rufescens TaxID=6454 RepID=UPI00201E78EC|nr:uncharacterized protein LOC124121318 [Haliotis rufescens]